MLASAGSRQMGSIQVTDHSSCGMTFRYSNTVCKWSPIRKPTSKETNVVVIKRYTVDVTHLKS